MMKGRREDSTAKRQPRRVLGTILDMGRVPNNIAFTFCRKVAK